MGIETLYRFKWLYSYIYDVGRLYSLCDPPAWVGGVYINEVRSCSDLCLRIVQPCLLNAVFIWTGVRLNLQGLKTNQIIPRSRLRVSVEPGRGNKQTKNTTK